MGEHLKLISSEVSPGAHAILIVDQAGGIRRRNWTCLKTSHCCPCRRGRRTWTRSRTSGTRDNWLSNRVFGCYDDIVAPCCEAWNNSSKGHGQSDLSECGTGRMGHSPCQLV